MSNHMSYSYGLHFTNKDHEYIYLLIPTAEKFYFAHLVHSIRIDEMKDYVTASKTRRTIVIVEDCYVTAPSSTCQ
jgi:hypothetical protein